MNHRIIHNQYRMEDLQRQLAVAETHVRDYEQAATNYRQERDKLKTENDRLRKALSNAADFALCFSHYNWCDGDNDCWEDCVDHARERGDTLSDGIRLFLSGTESDLHTCLCRALDNGPPRKSKCPPKTKNDKLRGSLRMICDDRESSHKVVVFCRDILQATASAKEKNEQQTNPQ